jgi:hypothetical protein
LVFRGIRSLGPQEAFEIVWQRIERILDLIHVSYSSGTSWNIERKAIVTNTDRRFADFRRLTIEHYNTPSGLDSTIEQVSHSIDKLNSQGADRLYNVLRFYRLATMATTPEPRFLNLWISLETLVQSRAKQSIALRIRTLVSALLSRRYIYRVLRNTLEDFGRMDINLEGLGIENERPEEAVTQLLQLLQKSDRVTLLKERLSSVPLLAFRIDRFADRFGTGEAAAKFLMTHYNWISWHLQRMYRVRSRIVHSADISAPLQLLVGHLRTYCRSSLLEVTALLSHIAETTTEKIDLDCLLQEVEDGYLLQQEILGKEKGDYPVEHILNPPLSLICL